jgi:hypothetical protein
MVSLSDFMEAAETAVTKRGTESQFYIYDAVTNTETSVFAKYASIDMEDAEAWVQDILVNGVRYRNPLGPGFIRVPPCKYDEKNLFYAGDMIKDSLDMELWSQISADIGTNPAGIIVLLAAAHAIQHKSASSSHRLIDDLLQLKIANEPGQNGLKFSKKVNDLARRIDSCAHLCPDIDSLVAQCYLGSLCEPFQLLVLGHYNKAENGRAGGVGWKKMIVELKHSYSKSLGHGLWTAAAKNKAEAASQKDEAVFKAMAASINALQQTVQKGFANQPTNGRQQQPKGPRRIPPGPG